MLEMQWNHELKTITVIENKAVSFSYTQGGGMGAMPTFDEKVKNRAKAQSDFQMQQAIMNAPKEADPNKVITQVGAQSAAQNANQVAQQQQANMNAQLQQNNQALQQQQVNLQNKEKKNQLQLSQDRRKNEEMIGNMNSDFKAKMIDSQKEFVDFQGREKIRSEKQMSDYLVAKQASQHEWKMFEQAAREGHQRRMNTMRNTQQVLKWQLENNYDEIVRDYGREKAEELRQIEKDLNKKLEDEANKGDLLGVVLGGAQVVAGVVSCIYGNPMGIGMAVNGMQQVSNSYGDGSF